MQLVRIKLDYIFQPKAKGRTYTYYRRAGQRIRIGGEPGSAEFLEHYQQIHASFEKPKGQQATKPRSLKALIENYKAHHQYLRKKPKTKKDYLRYLNHLETKYGHLPVATLPTPFVVKLRDNHQKTPRTGNGFIQIMSILMSRAKEIGWINHNPAKGINLLDVGKGHRPWEETEIAAFRAQWALGTLERTAFEVALNTGQRGGDCVAMERVHIQAGIISVTQQKTNERVWVPISRDLREALDAWDLHQQSWIERRLKRKKPRPVPIDVQKMILTGEKGRALKGEGTFSHLLNDAYKGVDGLSVGLSSGGVTTHGLRYTAATRLYELGCTFDDIASVTGHETVAMVKKYIEKKRRAQVAIDRLDAGTTAQKLNESVKPAS